MTPIDLKEAKRLQDLYALNVLNSSSEPEYDKIVAEAAAICGVPIALVSLVADNFQWFKAKTGLEDTQTPRNVSFCSHAIGQEDVFVIENATENPLFAHNALVTGAPNIRFYAGAPLALPGGSKIGTLCIIDSKPRKLGKDSQLLLQLLARQVVQLLLHRKTLQENKRLVAQAGALQLQLFSQQLLGSELQQQAGDIVQSMRGEIGLIKEGKFTRKSLSAYCEQSDAQLQTIAGMFTSITDSVALQHTHPDEQQNLQEQINTVLTTLNHSTPNQLLIHNDITATISVPAALCVPAKLLTRHLLTGLFSLPTSAGEIELFATQQADGSLEISYLISGFAISSLQAALPDSGSSEVENPSVVFGQHWHFIINSLEHLSGGLSVNQVSNKRMLINMTLPAAK